MKTITDDGARPCYRCKSTRAHYSCHGGQADRKCAKCGAKESISVAAEVPRKVVTVEQWRAWWKRIDETELSPVA